MVAVALIYLFLIALTLVGASVNDNLESHRTTLANISLRLQGKLVELRQDRSRHVSRIADMERAVAMIKDCLHVIEITNDSEPYTIFGIPAQTALTTSVLTTAVSFYSTLYSMYQPGQTATASQL